ncbi:hypothetical protein V502_00040 [Pseudogymnoascus sp. VKM F-4520 (FW-2644)]|nr:hypothetical protein V502_00040 [Pseudogymnoascus sp. VKM F-4520 (FW-2644)]
MAARKPRLIDKEQLPEASKSVKVLCLGMCRTGTTSLLAALTTLGYTPIHMTLILEDARQKELWTEAIEKTFISGGSEAPYGRAEFDVLLSGYDVALDVPCAIFGEQLINAYPDAKVILTTRPVGSWITSMQSTIWKFMRWPSYRILRYVEPEFMGSFLTLVELIFFVHNKNNYGGKKAEQAYISHNKRIRELTPADRLLELSPPFHLDELCNFLGKPIPPDGYPHANSTQEYTPKIYRRRNKSLALALKRLGRIFFQLFPFTLLLWYIYHWS